MTRLTPILAAALTLLFDVAAKACPMCKDSVPNSDAQFAGGVPSGFNTSIYFMLGAMVCVLGMITFTLIKGARSTNVTRAAPAGRAFPVK